MSDPIEQIKRLMQAGTQLIRGARPLGENEQGYDQFAVYTSHLQELGQAMNPAHTALQKLIEDREALSLAREIAEFVIAEEGAYFLPEGHEDETVVDGRVRLAHKVLAAIPAGGTR